MTLFWRLLSTAPLLLLCWVPLTAQQSRVAAERGSRLSDALEARTGGKYDEAEKLLEAVIYGPNGAELPDSLTALAYHTMGNLYYDRAQDSVAVIYYERAIALRDRLFTGPHNQRAHSRLQAAASLRYTGREAEAAARIREALAIYEQVEEVDSLNWLQALNELASQANNQQDLALAVSATYRAVGLRDEMRQPPPFAAFLTSYRTALILMRLERFDAALPHARSAVEYAGHLSDRRQLANAYNLTAAVQLAMGDTLASYRNLTAGIASLRGVENAGEPLSHIYLNLAEYYAGRGDQGRALEYDRRAKELFIQRDDLYSYCRSDRTPEFLRRWGRLDEAYTMVNERLDYLTDQGKSKIDELTGKPESIPLIDLLAVRAAVQAARGRHREALADYELIFRLQDGLRREVTTPESRQYLSKNLRPFVDRAIALYYRSFLDSRDSSHLWKAFTLSERGRAYTLLATLQEGHQRQSAEEARLRVTIAGLQRRVSLGEVDQEKALETATLRLDRLQHRMPHNVPERAFANEAPPGLPYSAGAHLVEYHLAADLALIFHLSPAGRLTVYPLGESDRLADRISSWRTAIRQGAYRRKSLRPTQVQDSLDAAFVDLGLSLADQLLPLPLRQALHLRAPAPRDPAGPASRLVVIPDGVLHYLPFAALPLRRPSRPVDYREIDYLQRRVDLQYAYSLAYLREVSNVDTVHYREDLLAFAPSFAATGSPSGLSPLAYNRGEVRDICDLIPAAEVYYDTAATRARFLGAVGRSRILHLSSHGSVDSRDPNLSFIAFSQRGDSLDQRELLYFNDLYTLPLHNELTVLSACETSVGRLAAGETTMSLASAFAAAGARSTLTTLWQVDDGATKDAIVSFYRHLTQGQPRTTALAGAQRELLDSDYAHPFYWAGLALHGAGGPVKLTPVRSRLSGWTYGALALLLGSSLLYLLVDRRQKR